MNKIRIRVDDENCAVEWWDALDERYPELAAELRRRSETEIDSSLWDELAKLPGFADGPDYAPTALIYEGLS